MLGDKIKELRKSKRINQMTLSKYLSVSKGAIGMWETNKREPDIQTIKKIANYFNVSLDYLLENESKETNKQNQEKIKSESNYVITSEQNYEKILKLVLFDEIENITSDMINEVKEFAKLVKLREKQKIMRD